MQSAVFEATGIVGGYIVRELLSRGEKPLAVSRKPQDGDSQTIWIQADLAHPETMSMPPIHYLFSTVHPQIAAKVIPYLAHEAFKRAILFTSTSILTKSNSEVEIGKAQIYDV